MFWKNNFIVLLCCLTIAVSQKSFTQIISVQPVSKYFYGIGVNIHPIKYNSPTGNLVISNDDPFYFTKLKEAIYDVGFKYVRAAIPIKLMCGNPTHQRDSILAVKRLFELYQTYGVKTFWVINHYAVAPWDPLFISGCYLDTVKMDSASYVDEVNSYINPSNNLPFGLDYIYAVEGLNEPEYHIANFCRDTLPVKQFYQQKWDEITYRSQKGLFNKLTRRNVYSHIIVLAPSIWLFYYGAIDSLLAQGPIENYFQAGNLHPYPNVISPAYSWDNLKFHPTFFAPLYLQTFYSGISNYGNNKPKYVTETGYLSQKAIYDTTYDDINEIAAAKYISFLHLEFFKNGIEKVIFYKLFENNSGNHDGYGFINLDYSSKPMFNTLKNISKILSDTAIIRQPISNLQFTTNFFSSSLRTIAYQLKDNELVLGVWRGDANSACYDFQSNSLINVVPINISFTFNQNNINKIYVYDPVYSTNPIDSSNNNSVSINLSDRLLLIKLKLEEPTSINTNQNVSNRGFIFPNPASNRLIVDGFSENDFEIIIYTLNGEEIKKLFNQKNIDISDLANGLYILRIKTPKQILNHKLLIMK